jgi:hypothetical protein
MLQHLDPVLWHSWVHGKYNLIHPGEFCGTVSAWTNSVYVAGLQLIEEDM